MELIETEKDYVRDLGLIVEVGLRDILLTFVLRASETCPVWYAFSIVHRPHQATFIY